MHRHRLDSVLHRMAEADLSQMVVADPAALFYLTGTWMRPGERMLALLLTRTRPPTLFVNALFVIPADLGAETVWFTDTDDGAAILARYVDPTRPLGIDKNWPARFLLRLMELSAASRFVNASALVDGARMHKDEQERAAMRAASALNDQAMGRLLTRLPDRPSEQRLARALAGIYDDLGADGFAFDPIIAYGPNAAEGHHAPGDRRLSEGDAVILDIGCTKDRYCSDMTRTVFYRRASAEARTVYGIVLEAQAKAIARVRPGVRFCDIDAAARGHIEAAGYGRGFTHRTGHAIGLEVHDPGDVSAANRDRLQPGMVFSVEPSIKLPGAFGVRIEDLVLVTDDGCEVLNRYDKQLTIVE